MNKKISEDDVITLFREIHSLSQIDDIGIFYIDGIKLGFNIDTFVKSTDAPSGMDYYYIGWKAVISSISDLYVKGISPSLVNISIGLSSIEKEDLLSLSKGIKDVIENYNIKVIKWDTNSSTDLFITVSCAGIIDHSIPFRSQMKEGDIIVVSDYFGLEGLGLKIMLGDVKIKKEIADKAVKRFCKPSPKFKKYIHLVSKGAHASTDSSDGLTRALWNLSRASNREIILTDIPIHPLLRKCNLPEELTYEVTMYGGEEYIGVFSIPKDLLKEAVKEGFINIGKVGKKGVGVFDIRKNLIKDRGWSHEI